MDALEVVGRWPGRHGAGAVSLGVRTELAGDADRRFALASVTKLVASLAVLTEVAAGRCELEDPVGPPGATLAHLLSHAGGLPLDGETPVAAPGARRVYSNTGIELAVAHAAARAGADPPTLLARSVLEPLGMSATTIEGPVSSGAVGTVVDLCALAGELLAPTLVPAPLAARACEVAYPGLAGVLPGFGRQTPCDWGLGVEVKGAKRPHWTGASWPPATVGHFGRSGGFVAVDVSARVAVVTLGDEAFGPWATATWPGFTDEVRASLCDRAR